MVIEFASPLFWDHRTLYFRDNETRGIKSYDYDTQCIEHLLENVELYQSVNNKVIAYTHPHDETIHFYDVSKHDTVASIQVDPSGRATFNFRLSPNGERILGSMYVDRSASNSRVLFVYDMVSGEMKHIPIPGTNPGQMALRDWVDDEQFLITVPSDDDLATEWLLIHAVTGEVTRIEQ